MKLYLIAIVSSLFIFSSLHGQNFLYSKSDEDSSPQRIVNDMGLNGINVQYSFGNFDIKEINQKENIYQLLSIRNFGHLAYVGKPALPAHIELVAIPENATFQLQTESLNTEEMNEFRIYPALKPARDTEGAAEPEFEIDEDFYNSNQFYPASPVEIVEIIEIRGLRFALVSVQPIQFNPVTGQLIYHKELRYSLNFTGGTAFLDQEQHSQNFLQMIERYPLNAASLINENKTAGVKAASANNSYDYIIVTQDNYLAAADSLAQWKRQMGYKAEIVSSAIWTTASITNAIHSRYQSYTPKPDYFVIIGDHNDVPAQMLTNSNGDPFGSDLYYVCMDGSSDYVADMARGRISVNSASQAMDVVMKIINYERFPIQDSSFYQNGVNCAQFQDDNVDGYADRRFTHTSENVRDYMIGRGYDIRRIYWTDNIVYPTNFNAGYYSDGQSIPSGLSKLNGYTWTGNAGHIKEAIDTGKFYVLHRDHGFAGGTGWAHPNYLTGNINQLTNGNKLPVVFSINCHTGEFTLNNCFAENFLRKSNGGAVGVFGASYYSYSGYNDGLTIGLFDGIWSNPGLLPNFGVGGVGIPTVAPHADIITMGDLLNHGLIRVTETWGGSISSRKYTNELFHYFGDPAMRIWTNQPDSLNAIHAFQINCIDSVFLISGVNASNVTATLVANNNIIGQTLISNDSGSIQLTGIQGNQLTLTLTARNKIPYIAKVNVASGGNLGIYANVKHINCHGDSLGSIEIVPACGYPPYSISWSTGDTINKIDNLTAGTYIVSISDTTQTTITDTIAVTQPTAPLSLNEQVNDAECNFQSSGSIQLIVSGGTQPYLYSWSNGYSGSNPYNLSANSYTVTVTDKQNCKLIDNYTISEPPALIVNTSYVSDTNNLCMGQSIANITGGIPPYTYEWNDPNTQTTPIASGLCVGLYKITVRDSNDCMRYRTVYVDNVLGISSLHDENPVRIFPNPTSDRQIYIDLASEINQELRLEVYNSIGKLVYAEDMKSHNGSIIQVNLPGKAAGVYHLRMSTQQQLIFNQEIILK